MKQLLAIFLTATLLLTLGGCSQGGKATPAAASAAPASQSGSLSAALPEAAVTVSASGRITADLGNNITVDATIDQPDGGVQWGIYQTEIVPFDGDAARSLLLEGCRVNDAVPPAEGMEYYVKGSKELIFRHDREGLSLLSGENGYASLRYLVSGTKLILENEPDFMTGGEAARLAQDTLKALGVETQVVRCTPVDQAGVAALVQEFRDRFGGDEESAANYAACPPCYVVDLCQVVDGVPLWDDDIQLTHGDVDTPDRFAIQPYLKAVVTAEGLHELDADNCIRAGAQVQAGLKVLNAEEIIAAVETLYTDIINTDPTTIRSLSLRYAVLPVSLTEKTRQLRPVWVLQGEKTVYKPKRGGEPMEFPLTLYFDALTGQLVEDSYQ